MVDSKLDTSFRIITESLENLETMKMTKSIAPGSAKIINIQALRGVAVLLVIALHLQENEKKYAHGFAILPNFFNIGTSGVDLFFVISGFVMVAITRGWFQKTGAIQKFLYHRATRIYPLYWFYSLLMLAIYLMQRKAGNDTRIVDLAASFLLLPQSQLPLLVVGWTLVHEIYFYLVFSLLLLLRENWLFPLLIIWGVVTITGDLIPFENPSMQLITSPLTLEFIGGSLIALIHFSGKFSAEFAKKSGLTVWIIAFVWWLLSYGICVNFGFLPALSGWLRVLVFGFPAALFVYSLVTLEKHSAWGAPIWLISIGDASFSIYLSHLLVIATIGRIWEKFDLVGTWANGIVLVTMFLAVLFIGMISLRLIERPFLKLTRRFE